MANTILITANWHTGALSQQTISRQYDNNRYVVQFVGYPEASEGNELDYYLLVWMSSAPGETPDEIAPIQLASDQWYISNVFTQQTQQIKFQMCALNTAGTFEAHSPIFTGFVRNSLEHDGTAQDIDVSTLFDAYREYLNELIIQAGAVVIDSTLSQSGEAADAKVTGDSVGLKLLTLDRIGWVTNYGIFDTSATNYRTSDYIQTGGNRHFRLIGSIQPFYTTNAGIVSCFDINQVFIGFALQILSDDGLTEHDFTVLNDTAYICVTTNKWTPAPSLCPLDWINTTDLYSYHKANSYKIYYGDAQLVNTGKCLKPDLTVVSLAAFNMSDPILCDGATQVTVLNAGDNSYYGVAFFTDTTISNDNFLRGIKFTSAITPSDPLTISVPKAAKYVVFSARVNFRAYIAYDYTHYNKGKIIDKVEGITNFADTPYKIVLGGDSITAGQGGTGYSATGSEIATIDGTTYRRNDNGYCWANNFKSYIESNYNATVTNNGISGTDSSFWNLNKSVLIPADTDLFILMIGANDRHSTDVQNPATLRLKLTRYYNNLYEIIRYCDANNIKIILMSPIPSSHDNEQDGTGYVRVAHEFQWNGVIAKLSAFYDMEHINLYNRIYMYALTRNENFESYLTDGLHPNDTGYRVMYYQILDGLGLAPHFDPIS